MPTLVNYTQLPTMMTDTNNGPYDFDIDLQINYISSYDVASNSQSGVNYEISYFFTQTSISGCKLMYYFYTELRRVY